MKNQRLFLIILSIIGIISVFLPWFSYPEEFKHDCWETGVRNCSEWAEIGIGWYSLFILVLILFNSILNKKSDKKNNLFSVITVLLSLVVFVSCFIRINKILNIDGSNWSINGSEYHQVVLSPGFGLYTITITTLLIIILSVYPLIKRKK
jgi:uncharacterized membrane protein